jgi:hypothetical protein
MTSKTPKLTREQKVWFVELILLSALDRIESGLPDSIDFKTYQRVQKSNYDNGALETAGMALGVFYAQLTDDGLGITDALACADRFDDAVDKFMENCWANKGKDFKDHQATLTTPYHAPTALYAKFGWPDPHKHAEAFVAKVFDKAETEADDEDGDTLSADQVITQIGETLAEADGEFIEDIANRVLTNNVKYVGDSMFEQIID